MDQWLASIYKTNQAEDLEKVAQHNFLQKLAEEEGIDLSGMSDDDLANLYAEVTGEGEAVEAAPAVEAPAVDAAATEAEAVKLAQEKFEEADFLGRVMAHAYTQELEKIAAQKAEKTAGFRGAAKAVGKGAERFGKRVTEVATGSAKGSAGRMNPRHAKGVAAGAAAAGAGAAFGAKKAFGKNKEASAFEKLAELRAGEFLQAAGVTPEMHNQVMQQQILQEQAARQQQAQQSLHPAFAQGGAQPQAAAPAAEQQAQGGEQPEQQLEGALDERALEILAGLGYNVDALIEQLSAQGGEGQQAQGQQAQGAGQPAGQGSQPQNPSAQQGQDEGNQQ